MREHQVKDNRRIIRHLLWGGLSIFVAQLIMQLQAFYSLSYYKGGLLNARMLLWEGLQAWPVLGALCYSLVVYLALLSIVCVTCYLAVQFVSKRIGRVGSQEKLVILIMLLVFASLIVVNVYHFPASLVRVSMVNDFQARGEQLPYYIAFFILAVVFAFALLEVSISGLKRWLIASAQKRKVFLLAVLVVSTLVLSAQVGPGTFSPATAMPQEFAGRPNIILIGLDSLRHDVVEDDDLRASLLPNLDEFLSRDNTTRFPNAYTPIGRTFVAWYSLLSGREPKQTGVRYNLQHLTPEQKASTIVSDLNEIGYLTVYGSDEKRFSAIDESFGFDHTIGPPAGAAEWILSFLEDTPIHNILRESVLAKWMFPFSYGNRASYSVYKPDHFVELVRSQLSGLSQRQPLFLSLHLCLSHWPYSWSNQSGQSQPSSVESYFSTLRPLDNQFGKIMQSLSEAGVLENSIVFVFSDHGEGLVSASMSDDDPDKEHLRAMLPNADDKSWGHGNELLSLSQNRILVSVQENNVNAKNPGGKNERLTSLVDITSTIVSVAGLENYPTDGINLISTPDDFPENRILFMETGFEPLELNQPDFNIGELVRQGVSAYEITSDGTLEIKSEIHDRIISAKRRGLTDGRYILSSEMEPTRTGRQELRITAIEIPDSEKLFSEGETEAKLRLSDLKEKLLLYYGDELTPNSYVFDVLE